MSIRHAKLDNTLVCLFVVTLLGPSCASMQTRCLQQLPSSKTSDEALRLCQQALATSPNRADVFQQTMLLLTLRGEYEVVVRRCSEVLLGDSARSDARYYLAVALRRMNRCTEAIEHYRQYAVQRPDDPDPHFALGLCHEQVGDAGAAQQAYAMYLAQERRATHETWRRQARRRSASLATGAVGAPSVTAVATGSRPAPVAASQVTPTAASAVPPPLGPLPAPPEPQHVDCGVHKRAVAADPFATPSYDRLAACLSVEKDYPTAVRFMRIAVRDNPDYRRGWLHLGRAQQAMGNRAEAQASFAKACTKGVVEACSP